MSPWLEFWYATEDACTPVVDAVLDIYDALRITVLGVLGLAGTVVLAPIRIARFVGRAYAHCLAIHEAEMQRIRGVTNRS